MADHDLKSITADTDGPSADTELLFGAPDQASSTPKPYSFAGIKTWIKSWSDALYLDAASNLSDLASASTARTNLGMGTFYGGPPAAIGITNVFACNPTTNPTTGAIVALRLYMVPFYWPGGTATSFAFTVASAGAGGTVARVGIYNIKANGTPGTLVVEPTSGGAISVASTGTKTQAFSQAMNPGWYFACLISDGTPTLGTSADSLVCLGAAFAGTGAPAAVTYLFRALGALTALGDETGNTFSSNGVASTRPLLGIK